MTVDEAIESFRRRKSSIACNGRDGLLIVLESLGFDHRAGNTEGHKVFSHDEFSLRTGSYVSLTIDCGHKPNRQMKVAYVLKTIRFLELNKVVLEEILKEKNGEKHD
ncbi:hypothetical protein ACET76_02540 [Aeromonas caviae]|uniref:hypothetical protein n=1 Tax=Aeromonas TaxID=642 RepID=UPI00259D72A7|nr:hypothetical protein [Aeromonas rivipollensis]MDM5083755.1 hypothetical protein [Aeromonas rivipollensis]MDM5096133.1 hypothetical protein [Aeromonas rivipollensis]MDM5104314.1 hypothetical protein [Aeromonas rivipollensis]